MISTNNIPSNFANAITPYSTQGGSPVGEENPEARNTSFKPVEESAESAKTQSRRGAEESSDERAQVNERQPQDQEKKRDDERREDAQEKRITEKKESDDRREIERLSSRDREVRVHEQAHKSAGGTLAGAASFRYEKGPNGVSYAVSGEVPISLSNGSGDPKEALEIARRVQRAALAPAEPSVQDRQVAAQAAQLEQQALQDIAALSQKEAVQRRSDVAAQQEEQKKIEDERREQNRTDEKAKADRERLERNKRLEESQLQAGSQLVDINQRLIDIGVASEVPDAGSLINSNV